MKNSIFISIIGHFLILGFIILNGKHSGHKTINQNVYNVELKSMPFIQDKNNAIIKDKKSAIPSMQSDIQSRKMKAPNHTVKQAKSGDNASSPNIVGMDNFPFEYYLQILNYKLKQNWTPPPTNNDNISSIRCRINFQITRYGQIQNVSVIQKSENDLYDQIALIAVMQINNMPPLPDAFREDKLTVTVEFEVLQ